MSDILSSDVPLEHRKRIFIVLKTSENAEIGMNSVHVSTGIGGSPVETRNIAIYGGFTGVCTNPSQDALYVTTFAHNSVLYTGLSDALNYAPRYGHLGPINGRRWMGMYYPSDGSPFVSFTEGIAYSGSSSTTATIVTAYGADLYNVGF